MKTKFIYSVCLILILSITSCSLDDVKVDDLNVLTEDLLVRDESSAKNVLNKVYESFRREEIALFNAALMVSGNEQKVNQETRLVRFGGNNIDPKEVSPSDGFYNKLYYTINTSNYLISQLEDGKAGDIEEGTKNTILGEAKTLRAFARFMLLRTFGQFYDVNSKYGIVISNKPVTKNDKLPRSTVKESYNAIIKDLTFAINSNELVKPHFYVTQTTAKAFLAKVYLYQKEYIKAEELSKEIIDNASDDYDLEGSYSDIYDKRWNSKEVLFAPIAKAETENYYGTDLYSDYVLRPTDAFKSLADASDGVLGNGNLDSDTYSGVSASGFDPRFILAYQTTDGEVPYQSPKYPDKYYDQNTFYFMRIAEVYLIYAEAAARNNNLSEAVTHINKIRTRAGGITSKNSTDKAEILKFIREEKILELFLEMGETWFDIIRYIDNGDLTFDVKKSLIKKEQFTFPIPIKAMSGNKNLVQNPGY